MTANELFEEIKTLSPAQLKNVCSYIKFIKNPNNILPSLESAAAGLTQTKDTAADTGPPKIEKKTGQQISKKETTEFLDYYSAKLAKILETQR